MSDYLKTREEIFSHIMTRTSCISMR